MTQEAPRHHAARAGVASRPSARSFLLVAVVTLVAACGGGSPASAVPSSSVAVTDGTPDPKATPWPSPVMESVIALGSADAEIWKAGADIAKAADTKDVEAMWGAADGLVKLIDAAEPNVEALESYPHTTDLGSKYRAAFVVMREGAVQLRDSITAGDAAGVVAGSKRLAEGITLYGKVRADVQSYVNDALAMKKRLLR